MSEQIKNASGEHSLILKNRESVTITGVCDVIGFDEQTVNLSTNLGGLLIKGNNLHINKLDVDSMDISIDGNINSLQYLASSNKSVKSKLFR